MPNGVSLYGFTILTMLYIEEKTDESGYFGRRSGDQNL